MKVSKSVLKALIKECLIEILVEGFDAKSVNPLKESLIREPKINKQEQEQVNKPAVFKTGNPIMDEIFEHTAKTTLQEQTSAEIPTYTQILKEEKAISTNDDEIPMIESQQNKIWTTLAFAQPKK